MAWSIAGKRDPPRPSRERPARTQPQGRVPGLRPYNPDAARCKCGGPNTTVQGNWRGVDGTAGYQVVGDKVSARLTPLARRRRLHRSGRARQAITRLQWGGGATRCRHVCQTATMDVTITDGTCSVCVVMSWTGIRLRGGDGEVRDARRKLARHAYEERIQRWHYWRWTTAFIYHPCIRTGGAMRSSRWFFVRSGVSAAQEIYEEPEDAVDDLLDYEVTFF